MVRSRLRSGRWQEVAPDVFLLAGAPMDWPTHVLAACLATGGVASHRTAAVLLGVDGFRPGSVEVTVERGASGSRVEPDGVTVHRSRDLGLAAIVMRDSVPTTDPARLAADLGAVVGPIRYERAIEDLIGSKQLSWEAALHSLLRHARRGRDGVGPLRRLLEERWGDEVPESALEQAFLRLVRERQLPVPTLQHEVHDAGGLVARVDAAYVHERIAIELDGVRWHLPSHTFEADHRKRARLQAAGWTVLAFTWRMLMDEPGAVVRAIRSVLGRQGARNVHPDGPKQMAERTSAGTACATGPRSA